MASSSQRTPTPPGLPELTGPVLADMARETTPGIAALDARWAALVLAGQAVTYAVDPAPDEALRDVLRMVGLVGGPLTFGRRS